MSEEEELREAAIQVHTEQIARTAWRALARLSLLHGYYGERSCSRFRDKTAYVPLNLWDETPDA